MDIKKKPAAIALAGAYVIWELVIQPIWNLNIERMAEKGSIDKTLADGGAMRWLNAIIDYIPSSFGLGFVIGGLIFAYWDVISKYWSRWILRKPIGDDTSDVKGPSIRAWVGLMEPSFNFAEGYFKLRISVIGVGEMPFIVKSVDGFMQLKFVSGSGGRKQVDLPKPHIHSSPTDNGSIALGYYGNIWIEQRLPASVLENMPDTFTWSPYPTLDFSNLEITLLSEDGETTKRLELWDSIRMTAGEGVIASTETKPLFKSDEDKERFQKAMGAIVNRFGAKL